MVLVDTSIWVDHLRCRDHPLQGVLQEGQVLSHPMVIGELACGHLTNRRKILALLGALPSAKIATHEEVMALIEERALAGQGIGIVDAHLLASCLLTHVLLWTEDRNLNRVAKSLALATP